jgi:hypothetical protein
VWQIDKVSRKRPGCWMATWLFIYKSYKKISWLTAENVPVFALIFEHRTALIRGAQGGFVRWRLWFSNMGMQSPQAFRESGTIQTSEKIERAIIVILGGCHVEYPKNLAGRALRVLRQRLRCPPKGAAESVLGC